MTNYRRTYAAHVIFGSYATCLHTWAELFFKGRCQRMILCATSALLLMLMFIIPRHINAQEKEDAVKTFRMKITAYFAKGDDDKPMTTTMRFAIDGKGNLHGLMNLHRLRMEVIVADGFIYSREIGVDSESGDWVAMSVNTFKAISSSDPRELETLDNAHIGRTLFDGNNMQLQGIETLLGRKTRVYVNIKPVIATKGAEKMLYKAKKWISAANGFLRKFEINVFDAETNEFIGTTTAHYYAFNSRIVIKAPKLPDKPRNPHENYLFFDFEPCESSPDRPCQKNEMILKWTAEHVKNAVGVILFREDDARGKPVRLGTVKKIKGTFTQTLCEQTRYRIVAIDKRGRPLRKTADTMTITNADLEACP